MSNYTSFLICDHGEYSEVYVEGQPIGIVRGSKFEVHQRNVNDQKQAVVVPQETIERMAGIIQVVIDSHTNHG